MPFFGNKRRDFSIQPPRQQVDGTPFFVTDSANIDFTLDNLNLTADLTFTGVAAGTYGDATNIPILEIDQWGRVTGVTTIPIGGGGGTYTVNNGLSPQTTPSANPNNFQLGGPLIQNTTIDASTFLLDITGTGSNVFKVENTATGVAGIFESAGNTAIAAESTVRAAIVALTNGNQNAITGITKVNGNTIEPIILAARAIVSGSVGVGLGGSIDTRLTRSSSNTLADASSLITYWSSIGSFSATWELHTVTANILTKKMSMLPTGQLNLDKYGQTPANFPGTAVWALGVDASGNVVEFTASSTTGDSISPFLLMGG